MRLRNRSTKSFHDPGSRFRHRRSSLRSTSVNGFGSTVGVPGSEQGDIKRTGALRSPQSAVGAFLRSLILFRSLRPTKPDRAVGQKSSPQRHEGGTKGHKENKN